MKNQVLTSIKNANSRGMRFHVVCESQDTLGGIPVGTVYHSSWNSLDVAKVVASKEVGGVVYNDGIQLVK